METLSIDPGKRSIAWALWVHGWLKGCGYLSHKEAEWFSETKRMFFGLMSRLGTPDVAVVELPRIYPKDRSKRPNDCIDLSAITGLCGTYSKEKSVLVHPQEWKGQLPKNVSRSRIMRVLNPAEKTIAEAFVDNHNVMDAIGIGLWFHKRR